MAWSGGTYRKWNYTTNGWTGDASLGVGIEAGRHDSQDDDFMDGINQCLNKAGQNSMTGNLNMGGTNKITNIANGTNRTDVITVGQVQDGAIIWCGTSGGSANAQTLTPSPAISSYVAGQVFRFIAGFTTTSTLTLQVSGIAGPKNCILKGSSAPLSSLANVTAGATYEALYDGTNFQISNLMDIGQFTADAGAARVKLYKSRGTTYGTNTIVQNGDGLGQIDFYGASGTEYTRGAYINATVSGTPGATNDMPTSLTFATSADGSGSPTERMRIDNNGDVGIAGTVPAGGGTRLYVKKDVAGYGGILVDNQDQRLSVTSNFVSGVNQFGSIQATTVATGTVNKLVLNPLGGNVLINKQSDVVTGSGTFFTQAAANYPALLINTKDFSGTVNVLQNHHAGTYVGGVNYSNTATSFPTSSDYRLKENVVPLANAVTRIEQLNPCRFNFIVEPGETIDGFLAHEVAEVVPNAVEGEKDAVNEDGTIKIQSLDHSKLVPLAIAAIQELAARVAALEAA